MRLKHESFFPMTTSRPFLLAVAGLLVAPLCVHAQPSLFSSSSPLSSGSVLCENGECQPAISDTTYFGRPALRLTDGKCEAVVVPSLGRVMRYGKVGGANLLWNAPVSAKYKAGEWKNFGGDKTWLAPQSSWSTFHGTGWPPDPAFDGTPHSAQVLSGGKVKLVSQTSPTIGIRLERMMWFNAAGEFVVEQCALKTSGAPVRVGLWSISQSVPGASVFLPIASDSVYKNGYFRFGTAKVPDECVSVANGLLRVDPVPRGGGKKFGVDAPIAAIASVRDGVAWVQRAAKPKGQYPDGADEHGFPVELYVSGDANAFYAELELLGPLVNMVSGQKQTHTVKWSLHDLPSNDVDDAPTQAALAALLR